MSRPWYETQGDLNNETSLAEALARKWECQIKKLPVRYGLDYAFTAHGNDVLAAMEIKVRTTAFRTYPTYLIALSKIMSGNTFFAASGRPAILVVKFTDGIYQTPLNGAEGVVQFAGRQDRGDWQDMEPCKMIPMEKFKQIK